MNQPPWPQEQQLQPQFRSQFQPQLSQSDYQQSQHPQWQQPMSPQYDWSSPPPLYPSSQYRTQSYQPSESPPEIFPQKPKPRQSLWLFIGALLLVLIVIGTLIFAGRSIIGGRSITSDSGTTSNNTQSASSDSSLLPAPVQISPLNGTVFNNYPRTTTLKWKSVPGAASYVVRIYLIAFPLFSPTPKDNYCTDTSYYQGNSTISISGAKTSYTFNFFGAQPGCWQVWAVDSSGQAGTQSPLWDFTYTQ